MIGRWSEFKVVLVSQLESMPKWELVIVISGEDGSPLEGTLVGLSWFITINWLVSRALLMLAPRVAALSSRVEENQRSSCALKSPIMRTSSVVLKCLEVRLVGWRAGCCWWNVYVRDEELCPMYFNGYC